MCKKCILLLACALNSLLLFSGSPQLVWHQSYGDPALTQKVLVTTIDNYDNLFVAGFVNFGTYGNIIINCYDGVGNMKWNRLYNNTRGSSANDIPVALFPDNQGDVTMVGYINGSAVVTHILSYVGPGGYLSSDVSVGDTSAGNKTYPLAVLYDGISAYYMVGQLNSVSNVFKCDNAGNILWSTPLHNNFNNQVGCIIFDPFFNIVVGVTDSSSTQVIIHRYDYNTGAELPGLNTHVNALPANDNFVKVLVDQYSNFFVAATGIDSAGRTQWVVDKFDTTGTRLWSALCKSAKGHSNTVNSFLLDHNGDILISGPFSDIGDTLQYAAVYKISGDSGRVLWSTIDSQFLVNAAVAQADIYNNVYLGSTKTPSTISPYYSNFSLNQLTADSGKIQWVRSFDNTANNNGLIMQVNNFGDLFLATNNPTNTGSTWFLARVGNAAGDSLGTGLREVAQSAIKITVFPNPFTTSTNVGFTIAQNQKLSLKVYDIAGQILQNQEVQSITGYNQIFLKESLPPGVYLLKLEGTDISCVQRVVVY